MLTRLYGLLALLGLSLTTPLGALSPCGAPGTITTVTAPDGDYLAAFSDYTIYPPIKYETVGGPADKGRLITKIHRDARRISAICTRGFSGLGRGRNGRRRRERATSGAAIWAA